MTTKSDEFTPIVKVGLKRADVGELIMTDPVLLQSPFVRALGSNAPALMRQGTARRYPDRVVLFQQGDDGGSLFFVLAGDVRLFARRGADGVELKPVHRGGVVGEAEVLAGTTKRVSAAVAQGPVDIVELPRALLLVNGQLPQPVKVCLEAIVKERSASLDELSDFLSRW